jgi:hypothetical protein
MRLLKSQKNELLEAIIGVGLDPNAFELMELSNPSRDFLKKSFGISPVTYIEHKESKFYFGIFKAGNGYSPDSNQIESYDIGTDWTIRKSRFKAWLTYLKRELQVPDLWRQLKDIPFLFAPSALFDTISSAEKFSAEQVNAIDAALNSFKEEIKKEATLSTAAIADLDKKIDYLIEKSKASSKIDWKNIFVGQMVSIIFENFPTEQAQAIWIKLSNAILKTSKILLG